MAAPFELFLALRYLRFHRGRTFLSVITVFSMVGVTVGTAALVVALALMAGFEQDVRARIHSGSAHLTILSVEQAERFEGAERLVADVEAVAGVTAAAPVIYTPALLSFEGLSEHGFAELLGIDPAGHARVILGEEDTAGPFAGLERATSSGRAGILLGEQLASKLGARAGDLVRTLVPQVTLTPWSAMPRTRVYEVVGTYNSEHFQEDSMRAYVSLADARALLRAPGGSSWVEVRLDDIRRLATVKQRLRDALSPGWYVVDLIEQNHQIFAALRTEKLILFLAIGLIVVVAALNIVSMLILMVADKTKEIGTLTAMGASPGGIARVFVLQGLVIGAFGSVTGLAIGAVSCWVLDTYRIFGLDPEVYFLNYIPFDTQPVDLLFVGAASLLVSLVATIYPALKAAHLDPLDAIRYE